MLLFFVQLAVGTVYTVNWYLLRLYTVKLDYTS